MTFKTVKEMIEYRNWLSKSLLENVCVVSFVKKDGETRVMTCTTNPGMIPVYERKTDKIRKPNDYVFSAFDLNKTAYRSFLLENVFDVKILKKEEIKEYVQESSIT
jgi:hypothetical protein